jgi:peroxiredoxin
VDIGEGREIVQAYTQELGLTFPTLLDEKGTVAQRYLVLGIPTSFFINRQGTIYARHTGPLDESLIKKYLDKIL